MKIGIYTIFQSNNFGAQLQAYATQTYLRNLGHETELVYYSPQTKDLKYLYSYSWFNWKGILLNIWSLVIPSIWIKKKRISKFQERLIKSRKYVSLEELSSNPPSYDIHLVGSDQVWNTEKGINYFFFLSFLPVGTIKLSYGPSFGNITSTIPYKNEICRLLSSFEEISVRENDAVDFLNEECRINAVEVIDPTFLLSTNEWDELAGRYPIIKNKYILYYGFTNDNYTKEAIRMVRDILRMPVVGVSVSILTPYRFDRFYQSAGPNEFLNLVKYSSFVLTSSYHGLAFAMNYKRNFVVLPLKARMNRMRSLLDKIGLATRIVNDIDTLKMTVKEQIDYTKIEPLLNSAIQLSKEWLTSSLNNR